MVLSDLFHVPCFMYCGTGYVQSIHSADKIPIRRLHGSQLTPDYFDSEGFDVPLLCEKKDGLGLAMPPTSFSIHDVEQLVGE